MDTPSDDAWFRGQATAAISLANEILNALCRANLLNGEGVVDIIDKAILDAEERQGLSGRSAADVEAARYCLEEMLALWRRTLPPDATP